MRPDITSIRPAPVPNTFRSSYAVQDKDIISTTDMQRGRPLVPDAQRRRVRKACDRCRQNKLKCDGSQPCQRCRVGSWRCSFAVQVSSRLQHDPDSSNASNGPSERERILESILQRCGVVVPKDLHLLKDSQQNLVNDYKARTTSGERDRVDEGGGMTREVSANRDGDSIVVNHVPTPQTHVHDQGKTYFEGVFSSWAFCDTVQQSASKDAHETSNRQTAFQHSILNGPNSFLSDLRPSLLAALPPLEALQFLTENYFLYVQSNFCIIHPEIFSRKLDAFLQGKDEFSTELSTSHKPVEFVCLLFIILAMGTHYAGLEQEKPDPVMDRSVVLSASTGLLLEVPTPTPRPNPGWNFYEISRRLLSEVVTTSSSMTGVQACLLHGGYLVGTSAHDVAYIMLGLAVRMAINMGMHKEINSDILHPHVRELRNRLWWSIFTRDRLFISQMGRPISIEDDEVNAPLPTHIPELVVSRFNDSVDNQIALIKLCKLLGKIIKTIYSSFGSNPDSRVINTTQFLALQSDLEQWKADLPEGSRISPSASRGTFHVHLTHEQTTILLNRLPLIHAAVSMDNSSPGEQRNSLTFFKNAAKRCVRAALNTIKILKLLRERKLLCEYTCQDSLYCSSALHVLLLSAKIELPNEDTKGIIADGIFMLRELALGNNTASSALQGIIKGFNRLFKNQGSQTSTPRRDAPTTGDVRASGKRAWQDWMLNPSGHRDRDELESTPTPRPHGNTSSNGGNGLSMDPFNAYTAQAIDYHTAFQAPTDRPVSENTMPVPSSPGPSISSFDTMGAGLPTTGEPLWFLGLGKSFSLFDGDLGQNLMNEGFDIWDSMPADYDELSFQ